MDISILDFSSKSMIKNLQLILDLKEGEIMNLFNWWGGGGRWCLLLHKSKIQQKEERGGERESLFASYSESLKPLCCLDGFL